MSQYGSLTNSQMALLNLHAGVFSFDDLPEETKQQVLEIKDHETTWSDVQRYLGDLYNPHWVDSTWFSLFK